MAHYMALGLPNHPNTQHIHYVSPTLYLAAQASDAPLHPDQQELVCAPHVLHRWDRLFGAADQSAEVAFLALKKSGTAQRF